MFEHLLTAFTRMFTTRRSRLAVGGLILSTAALPVCEIGVLRLFSRLIIDRPASAVERPGSLILWVGVFLVALLVTRLAHHGIKFGRVRVFRRGFEETGLSRRPSDESWEWSMAFELSAVIVSMIQIVIFGVLLVIIDWPTGILNALLNAGAVAVLSLLYRRQYDRQRNYVSSGGRPGSVAIAERVGGRIRDAEIGAVLASAAMVASLVGMLLRTVQGAVSSADAVVLFLSLQRVSGQLGSMSSGAMRFARALARRGEY